MTKNQPKPIRLFWKYTYFYEHNFETILYRIEDLIVYQINLHTRDINILANVGQVIPKKAEPLLKEDYEEYIIKYLL